MHHVIVGNGPAGVTAAEALRRVSADDRITLIGDEPGLPYSRMAIPYLLMGEIGEEGTLLRKEPGHFERFSIDLVNDRVLGVDTSQRQVSLKSGKRIGYDRLLIASGSHANRPAIPGSDLPNVHPCWTLADARAILARLKPGARVLQVGAGFIGCIIMEALATRGAKLTVVEMGNRMVPRMMTEGAGGLIRQWCETKGIRVLVNTKVQSIEHHADGLRVQLSPGDAVTCDLVIWATGVSPNIDFLKGRGIECGDGILVNHEMQSSVAGVFAAGDVAQGPELGSARCTVNAVQPVAAEQARIAALNMAGRVVKGVGQMPLNVLDTLGLVAASMGQWQGVAAADGGTSVELRDDPAFRYLRLEFRDEQLIGATSLGHTQHLGVMRGLIEGRVRLGRWKEKLLAEPTRLMEAYLACAQKAA